MKSSNWNMHTLELILFFALLAAIIQKKPMQKKVVEPPYLRVLSKLLQTKKLFKTCQQKNSVCK